MKICKNHWDMIRASIAEHGMGDLISKSAEAAFDNEMKALDGGTPDFEPLMSHNWHWSNNALAAGGLAVMMVDDANPENDGHPCPVCLYVKHQPGFEAKSEIDSVSGQMRAYAIEQGLIPKPA